MTDEVHGVAARGFEAGADAYARARPGYPEAAFDHVAEALRLGPASRVLDLGAGTGKFTAGLVTRGYDVVAVEPVERMRARLATDLPAVEVLDGTGEHIPLGDASVDAIVVAQAFHWFRHDEALAEMHRVLRPGGRFALVWNVRDERIPWVAELTEIIAPHEGEGGVRIPRHREGAWRAVLANSTVFDQVGDVWSLDHGHEIDAQGLVDRVASTSFIAALPTDTQAEVFDAVRRLTERPPLAGRATFAFPYICEVEVFERR